MKKTTQPRQAWGLTIAAALDLFAFVLLAASNPSPILLSLFGLCEVVLILCAVGAWKKYIENMIETRCRKPSADPEPSAG